MGFGFHNHLNVEGVIEEEIIAEGENKVDPSLSDPGSKLLAQEIDLSFYKRAELKVSELSIIKYVGTVISGF